MNRDTSTRPLRRLRDARPIALVALLVLGASLISAMGLPVQQDAQAAVPVYVRINFQTPASITPSGFLADIGLTYRQQSNGLTYGWDQDLQSDARDRNAELSPNQSWDTLNHLQKSGNRTWRMQLASGSYWIRICCTWTATSTCGPRAPTWWMVRRRTTTVAVRGGSLARSRSRYPAARWTSRAAAGPATPR